MAKKAKRKSHRQPGPPLVEVMPPAEGDPDLEGLDQALLALPDAVSAFGGDLDEFAGCKQRATDLLKLAAPTDGGSITYHAKTTKRQRRQGSPGTYYAAEPNAVRAQLKADLLGQARRLQSATRRQKAEAAIDALFEHGDRLEEAEERLRSLIDRAIELAKATSGKRESTRTTLLLRDLERLRSFTLPTDRPYFDIDDTEHSTSAADVVADLRERRKDLLEDRVASFHRLGDVGKQPRDPIKLLDLPLAILDLLECVDRPLTRDCIAGGQWLGDVPTEQEQRLADCVLSLTGRPRTIGNAVKVLLKLRLVHEPFGKKGGLVITAAGLAHQKARQSH